LPRSGTKPGARRKKRWLPDRRQPSENRAWSTPGRFPGPGPRRRRHRWGKQGGSSSRCRCRQYALFSFKPTSIPTYNIKITSFPMTWEANKTLGFPSSPDLILQPCGISTVLAFGDARAGCCCRAKRQVRKLRGLALSVSSGDAIFRSAIAQGG